MPTGGAPAQAALDGASAASVTQLALDIAASPRVESLAQLRKSIDQSPRMQTQLQIGPDPGMGFDSAVLPQSDRSFDSASQSAGRSADPASAPSQASGCGAEAEAPVQAKPKEEKLQAKPKEEKIQGKAKEELRQRRTADATSSGGASPEATSVASASGLPPQLKSGVESLSGMSMDHVQVHYNSDKPAQLNALAYAQGSEIHVGPGQEQHLPHEAWHVVQQAQGRVRPTMQMQGGVPVNDDKGLEHEADAMGIKAMQHAASDKTEPAQKVSASIAKKPLQRVMTAGNTVRQLFSYGKGTTRKVKVTGNGTNECTFEECLSNSVEYSNGDAMHKGSRTSSPADWAGWLTVTGKSRNATQMHVVNARWGGEGGQKDGNIFPGSPAENSHHLHEGEKKFDEICFNDGTTAIGDYKYECTAAPDYGTAVDVSKGPVAVKDPTVKVKITDTKTGKLELAATIGDGGGLTFKEG